MSNPQELLYGLNFALESKNGAEAAALLERHMHPSTRNKRNFLFTLNTKMIPQLCSQNMSNHGEMAIKWITAMVELKKNNMEQAYENISKSFKMFLDELFRYDTGGWTFPLAKLLMRMVREYAILAENQMKQSGKQNKNRQQEQQDDSNEEETSSLLENAAGMIMKCFQIATADRTSLQQKGNVSKRWLLMDIANNLFVIYFRINKLRLCNNLIKTIDEAPNMPPFEQYNMSAKVTYQYYSGRIALFDSNFSTAREKLLYAYNNCLFSDNNRKLILNYLIPVQWICGKSPSFDLLEKYQLTEFIDLNQAYRTGDLRLFQNALDEYQDYFIRKGIFLIIERAKTIVYRNLFRLICVKIRKSFKIKFVDILVCLRYLGVEDIDIAEVECILSSLLYHGYIKGYLSHSHGVMVLSKQNAFPVITTQYDSK